MRTFTSKSLFRFIPTTALFLGAFFILVNLANAQGESGSWYNQNDPNLITACTQEAKQCPDGSYVGRTGPNCEFAACPNSTSPQINYLNAKPTNGSAPMTVFFTGYVKSTGYSIDFGDESTSGDINCVHGGCMPGESSVNVSHTYRTEGTYTAKLKLHFANNAGNCAGVDCNVVASVTIKVGQAGEKYFILGPGLIDSLTAMFATTYGDYSSYRPSATDGADTMIDFGDGSEWLWVQCKNVPFTDATQSADYIFPNFSVCHFVVDEKTGEVTDVHTYPKPGTYTAKIFSVPSNFHPCALGSENCSTGPSELAKLSIVVGPVTNFGISDIESITYRSLDPIPMAIDDEYAEYTIKLKTGETVVVTSAYFSVEGDLLARLKASGYTGTLDEFLAKVNNVTPPKPPKKPGLIKNFFTNVADAFKNMFTTAVDFFFPGFSDSVSDRVFSDLPLTQTTRPETHTIDQIEAIIINKAVLSKCNAGESAYQAYVITNYDELAVNGCVTGTELLDYLKSISQKLVDYHNFETPDPEELAKLPIYFGDAEEDLEYLLNDEPRPVDTNTVGLEVKVKNEAGQAIHDWVKGNVTIGPSDALFFRWDASEYAQCLPFLADNGTYALTRAGDIKMLTGNTETEGFNVFERTGLYHIECSGKNGSQVVDTGSIFVTISDNEDDHGVDPHTGEHVTVAIDETSPLKVTATYTDNYDADGCGPNYVGEINWGDGTVTKEPDAEVMLCNTGKSVSASHTYNKAQAYLITVKRHGQLKHRESVNLAAHAGSGFSASPTSGAAPLNVKFNLNTKKISKIEFGDGSSQSFSCGLVQGVSTSNLGSTQVAQAVCTSVGCGAGDYSQSSYYSESQYAISHFGATPVPIGGSSSNNDARPVGLAGPLGVLSGFNQSTDSTSPALCGVRMIRHTYATAGTYTAKAKTSEGDKTITITVGAGNAGELSANPVSGKTPLTVSFTYKHKGTATLSFGDRTPSVTSSCSTARTGETGEECTVTRSHTYEAAGKYKAKLLTGCLASESCGVRSTPVISTVEINVISDTPTKPNPPCAITGPGQDCKPVGDDPKPSQPDNPFWCLIVGIGYQVVVAEDVEHALVVTILILWVVEVTQALVTTVQLPDQEMPSPILTWTLVTQVTTTLDKQI